MQPPQFDLARRHIRLGGGCRVWPIELFGYGAVVLENSRLRVTILVDRGGAIYEMLWKPGDHDVLWRWDRGMRPAHAASGLDLPQGSFQDNFFGGWDLMFPSAFYLEPDETVRAGYHGDVWAQPWSWTLTEDSPDAVELELVLQCVRHPFVIRRTFGIERNSAVLTCVTRIDNRSSVPARYALGEHATWNVSSLLADGGQLELSGGVVHTNPRPSPGAKISPGLAVAWPHAPCRDGARRDLSAIGPEVAGSTEVVAVEVDDAYLALCSRGAAPKVEFRWDKAAYPYLVLWLAFGGDVQAPWFGTAEVLGAEPVCALPWSESDSLPALPGDSSVTSSWHVRVGDS